MKDPTSTQRRSSRQTSTQPPTIPQLSANTTTSPTPPLHHAGPTTTATTAETRPTTSSPNPPATAPNGHRPRCHGDITEPTWTEAFLKARPGSSFCHRPSPRSRSLFHMVGFVSSRVFLELSIRRFGFGRERPCPGAVRHLCNQLGGGGGCYCKGMTGYSSVNSELHVGI